MIFQKGILHKESPNIKLIPLIQLVQQNELLPMTQILKLMYQLTIRKKLEKIRMEDLFVNDCGQLNKLDIFIQQTLIKEDRPKKEDDLLNLLKDILIKFGLNPFNINKLKSFEEILDYILEKLNINLKKDDWRQQILQSIYGLEIKDSKCYNQNFTHIFSVKVPYYIQTKQDYILIKWVCVEDQKNRLMEVENYKKLKIETNNDNIKQLFCYNLELQNSTLLYLQKFSLTLKEYSERANSILNIKEKMKICSKLASELKKLHDRKKIHRDLKPENIMVTAKEIYTDKLHEITDQNINQIDQLQWSIIDYESNIEKGGKDNFRGTQNYLPPENMDDIPYEESYDIWQMGICFLEFMIKDNLHYTKNKDKRNQSIQQYLEKLKSKDNKSTYSIIMHEIISKMTNSDPKQRPKLEDVIKELNSALIN
ncbi:unnamed protein product [Paramecium primaurelia]|uniref:Protein kinase domain-containing protein n=1 Tax=Paramecium primaurelia TaxID=5886 RepID=A0A8S1N1I8_PARPR|nr:unnamed protein product [Paramecium primaurelia]